jgi:hypothetical protein
MAKRSGSPVVVYVVLAGMLAMTGGTNAFPVHETGMGVHEMSLAGAATTLIDYGAGYTNPGALAFITQRYFFGGFSFLDQTNDINVNGTTSTNSLMRFRFSPAGMILPVPVQRGGLTFSLAYYTPFIFDDVLNYSRSFTGTGNEDMAISRKYSTYGGLNYWSVSGALQVAPGLGLGCTFTLITGREDTRFTFFRTVNGAVVDTFADDFHDHYSRKYRGFEFRAGLLYQPLQQLRIGVLVVMPKYIRFNELVSDFVPHNERRTPAYTYDTTGRLYSSLEGAVGASYDFNFLKLFVDVHGRTPYTVLYPNDEIPSASSAAHARYGISGALEAPIVVKRFVGRLGYGFDRYDTHRFVDRYKNDDMPEWGPDPSTVKRNITTLAAGLGIERGAVGVDAGYRIRFWKLDTPRPDENTDIRELHRLHEAALTIKWRF